MNFNNMNIDGDTRTLKVLQRHQLCTEVRTDSGQRP